MEYQFNLPIVHCGKFFDSLNVKMIAQRVLIRFSVGVSDIDVFRPMDGSYSSLTMIIIIMKSLRYAGI